MRSTNHKYLILLTIIWIFSFVFMVEALAQSSGKAGKNGVVKELELSEGQRKQIRDSYKALQEELRVKAKKLKSAQQKLDRAMQENKSEDEVKRHFQAVQKAKRELETVRFNTSRQIRNSLTPKQRQKYQRAWKKKKKRSK